MTKRRLISWIIFYVGIVLAILVTYLFLQERYARNYPRQSSHDAPAPTIVLSRSPVPGGVSNG